MADPARAPLRPLPLASPTRPGRRLPGALQRLLIWLAIFAAWEAAYRLLRWPFYVFPAPSHLVHALLEAMNVPVAFGDPLRDAAGYDAAFARPRLADPAARVYNSPLLVGNLVSLARVAAGFLLSIALGVVLGLATWRWGALDRFLGPLFLGFQTLPSVCWVPLAIIAFGMTESGVLFVLVMGSVFAVALALRDGLRTIPPLFQRAGLMLGARGWKLYRYVLLPASLPAFAGSLRQGFSFAWRSLLGAEMLFSVDYDGLGALLNKGRDTSNVSLVVAIMIVMVCIGMLADRLVFARLQRAISARFGLS